MAKGEPPTVYTITGAQRALSQEQTGRTRRYLISMGIRTFCVIAAIFVPGWPRWVLIAGAVTLPYLAVVMANAGRENDEPGELGVQTPERPELPSPGRAIDSPDDRSSAVIAQKPLRASSGRLRTRI
jgi:hypothetical protein